MDYRTYPIKITLYRVKIIACILVALWVGCLPKIGQCALERDFQTWLNVTMLGNFHSNIPVLKSLKYWLEGQERFGEDSSRFSQALVRTGLGYQVMQHTTVWVGYAWIKTAQPFTTFPFEENRIWQQLLWIRTFESGNTILSRTRTEQRFLETSSKVAYRIRQLTKIAIPLKAESPYTIVISDEIFWHKNNFIGDNSQGFDQNRFFAGIGYQFNDSVIGEIGYMNQYIRRFGVPNFLTDILSINLYCTWE